MGSCDRPLQLPTLFSSNEIAVFRVFLLALCWTIFNNFSDPCFPPTSSDMNRIIYLNILIWGPLLPLVYSIDAKNGDDAIIRNLPCLTRHNQLYCDNTGSSYPGKSIEKFIEDNKALLRRMYGEIQEVARDSRTLEESTRHLFRRDVLEGTLDEMLYKDLRSDSNDTITGRARRESEVPDIPARLVSKKKDVCYSSVEIVTPYWASNSNGRVRAILNNNEFQQAIHQEICSKSKTRRCSRDCSCEQKYKWHRLLSYDPNNDCSGIFMDWFLFPSCCVCRCSNNPFL